MESIYPPHSRLFVTCAEETTEAELISAFQKYGSVQNFNFCKDRATGIPKGFAFIQFDKTSEAAAAMEALNGVIIGQSTRPLRVTVALSKEQSSSSGSRDLTQFLRLFLVVPKTATENDLQEYFSQFGKVDNVSIVKNRETKESKGYAYVKFIKFSDAARAFENCDHRYKVVFAKPKDQMGGRPNEHMTSTSASFTRPVRACTHIVENPDGFTSLLGVVSRDLTEKQIESLFDIPPGLEFIRLFSEPYERDYGKKVMAQYDSPGTAAYALGKLNRFEYPRGERVQLTPNYHYSERMLGPERQPQSSRSVSDLMQQVETLTKSLGEATRLLNAAGLSTHLRNTAGQIEAFRCSAKLPPPQPLAPSDSVAVERLFVVCEPGLPPQDALWDVFGRFGNLKELYILNGKNCGYVKYTDKTSAHRAMQTLNGQELYRMKLKVIIAEPQKENLKRPRTNFD